MEATVDLIKRIQKEFNNKYVDINYGGCCVFAAAMANTFRNLTPVIGESHLESSNEGYKKQKRFEALIRRNHRCSWYNLTANHVMLDMDGYPFPFDSDGFYEYEELNDKITVETYTGVYTINGYMTPEFAKDCLIYGEGWSRDFLFGNGFSSHIQSYYVMRRDIKDIYSSF